MDDLPEARVVLVGCGRYASLPDMPAAHHSVQALRGALAGSGAHVAVVENPKRATEVGWLVQDAAETLVLYYAGHAALSADGRLVLALAGSDPADPATWLRFEDVRRAVEASTAPDKLVVLDLCFADAARWADSPADLARRVERVAGVAGARTLVFCLASREAIYDGRAGGMTYVGDAFARKLYGAGRVARPAPHPDVLAGKHAPEPVSGNVAVESEAPKPVRYRVTAPRTIRVCEQIGLAAVVPVAVGFGLAVGSNAAAVVVAAVVALSAMLSELHVSWWGLVDVGRDGLGLHRGRSPAAFVKHPGRRAVTVGWTGVERVLVGRAGDRTRVTLHISAEAAARLWNVSPYTGSGGYRYGVLADRHRGFAWSLGDLEVPADEVGEAFRSAVPPGVDVVVLTAELPHHRPRRWALVTYLVLSGLPVAVLAFAA